MQRGDLVGGHEAPASLGPHHDSVEDVFLGSGDDVVDRSHLLAIRAVDGNPLVQHLVGDRKAFIHSANVTRQPAMCPPTREKREPTSKPLLSMQSGTAFRPKRLLGRRSLRITGIAQRTTGRRRSLKRFAVAASLAALWLIASSSPAAASVTIGRLDPAPSISCAGTTLDLIEPTVNSGTGYVVPSIPSVSALMISSWSHNGAPAAGTLTAVGPLTLKVFRKVADPATYQVVGHETRGLIPNTLNTFQARLPVQPGDVIGTNTAQPASSACTFSDPGETYMNGPSPSNLADGESAAFVPGASGRSLNVSAVVSPSNLFSLGKTTLNKKKGTATLTATVPNPGELTGSGDSASVASAAVISKTVSAPGDVQLLIKAKGKKKKKLNQKGKVKLDVAITYAPTGGDPATQSITVKLKKKL